MSARPGILVSGSTGLIGSALRRVIAADGGRVVALTRRLPATPDEVGWDPARQRIDSAALAAAQVEAVVHLGGAPIAQRWTAAHRREILASRVDSTALLARTLAALPRPPRTLLVASGVGYYGDGGEAVLDESSPPGTGFTADVCRAWEAASAPADHVGIRVLHARFGTVLSAAGGMLARLRPLFRLGLGGRIGTGAQWVSWIALDDAVGAIHFALATPALHGAVNCTAPEPVRNATLAATLGRVMRRPAVLPVPGWALRALYGEMATELLLAGQRAYPVALRAAGYAFRYPMLGPALRAATAS